jgi:Rod binding domain-containing protein
MEINPATVGQVKLKSLRPGVDSPEEQLASARALEKAYTDFVGKTFFGQMMKAMRSTVDKPAYFHGGQGEEVFNSQLDQQLADAMSDASAPQISQPMFARQFPRQAALIADADQAARGSMTDLAGLRRR